MRSPSAIAALLTLALWPALPAQEGTERPQPPPPEEAPAQVAKGIPWVPFGPEAFDLARETRRPILLYISALWEYHDHVMADTTYLNEGVQALLRDRFVPVRVDTDDRPDLFHRYGLGSWPTTAVLIYDGHPLYYPDESMRTVQRAGGTFFPPDGFLQYFGRLADYYQSNEEMVHTLARETDDRILQKKNADRSDLAPESLEVVVGALLDEHAVRADQPVQGSYHPEFDMADLAFYYWSLKPDRRVLDMALNHLVDLSRGGIHDRIGGGFFRMAHDALYWVPSFEKLPSVNAEALDTYLSAWQVTGHPAYREIAKGVLDFVRTSGWDATSHSFTGAMAAWDPAGGNGDYYTWTVEELKGILTAEEYDAAAAAFDIKSIGEMKDTAPRRNVIFMSEGPILYAARAGISREKAQALLDSAVEKMKAARDKRTAPHVDERVFGDWSGSMISAFLHASAALGDEEAASRALESLAILLERCRTGGGLVAHVCLPDKLEKSSEAFLADQGRVLGAMVDAYEHTGRQSFLDQAQVLGERVTRLFGDITTGGLSDTIAQPEAPGLLAWPYRDMKENMAAAVALLRLGLQTGEDDLVKAGRKAVESWADEYGAVARHASAFALASQKFLNPPLEVLVAGGDQGEEGAEVRARAVRLYHPWKLVRHMTLQEGRALFSDKGLEPLDGPQLAFCMGKECAGPFRAGDDLPLELESFISPGRSGQSTPPPGK